MKKIILNLSYLFFTCYPNTENNKANIESNNILIQNELLENNKRDLKNNNNLGLNYKTKEIIFNLENLTVYNLCIGFIFNLLFCIFLILFVFIDHIQYFLFLIFKQKNSEKKKSLDSLSADKWENRATIVHTLLNNYKEKNQKEMSQKSQNKAQENEDVYFSFPSSEFFTPKSSSNNSFYNQNTEKIDSQSREEDVPQLYIIDQFESSERSFRSAQENHKEKKNSDNRNKDNFFGSGVSQGDSKTDLLKVRQKTENEGEVGYETDNNERESEIQKNQISVIQNNKKIFSAEDQQRPIYVFFKDFFEQNNFDKNSCNKTFSTRFLYFVENILKITRAEEEEKIYNFFEHIKQKKAEKIDLEIQKIELEYTEKIETEQNKPTNTRSFFSYTKDDQAKKIEQLNRAKDQAISEKERKKNQERLDLETNIENLKKNVFSFFQIFVEMLKEEHWADFLFYIERSFFTLLHENQREQNINILNIIIEKIESYHIGFFSLFFEKMYKYLKKQQEEEKTTGEYFFEKANIIYLNQSKTKFMEIKLWLNKQYLNMITKQEYEGFFNYFFFDFFKNSHETFIDFIIETKDRQINYQDDQVVKGFLGVLRKKPSTILYGGKIWDIHNEKQGYISAAQREHGQFWFDLSYTSVNDLAVGDVFLIKKEDKFYFWKIKDYHTYEELTGYSEFLNLFMVKNIEKYLFQEKFFGKRKFGKDYFDCLLIESDEFKGIENHVFQKIKRKNKPEIIYIEEALVILSQQAKNIGKKKEIQEKINLYYEAINAESFKGRSKKTDAIYAGINNAHELVSPEVHNK